MFSMPSARALLSGAAFVFVAACSNGEASQQPQQEAAANQPAATQPAAEKTVTPIFAAQTANADLPVAVVYKSPTCGCCNAWVEHMKENGFRVEAHDTSDVNPIKDAGHVPQDGRSCHTAQIGKFVIEGHVPADQIKKLLAENPSDIAGLTVPGMVTGSPGMEGPNPQHYDILAFTHDGKTRVYASR